MRLWAALGGGLEILGMKAFCQATQGMKAQHLAVLAVRGGVQLALRMRAISTRQWIAQAACQVIQGMKAQHLVMGQGVDAGRLV